MIKKAGLALLGIVGVAVIAVLAIAVTKRDDFRITRSTTINAPPAQIYAHIADLQKNLAWTPFEKDPAARRVFSVVTSGPGATYAWSGNSDVGKGNIRITEAVEPSRVAMKLNMEAPFEAHNDVEFTLVPAAGTGTVVTWTMSGEQPFIAKILSTVMDCDAMVGGEFEKGLASLKAISERQIAQRQ